MSTVRYTGNAINRKQTDVYTVASPSAGSSVYTVTVNGKVYSYTALSAVAADVADALVDDFNAWTDIKELADSPASNSGAVITFQSPVAGVPFSNSYNVSGGGTFSGSTTISNSGSEVFDLSDNWSASISASDDLVLDIPNQAIRYRLTSLTTALTSFTIRGTFNSELGLPIINNAGYPEYRGCYATIVAPTVVIGIGDGSGPTRAYINTNAGAATTVVIHKTGSSLDNYPTVMLKHTAGGSNSFSVVRVIDGSVGIALLPGEAATVTSLIVGDDNTNPQVSCGVGVTLTTLTVSSGSVSLVSTPSGTTTIDKGSNVSISNGGAATMLDIVDGNCLLGGKGSSFTITDISVGANGTLDLSQGQGVLTVTNGIKVWSGARIIDPLNRLASSTIFIPQKCKMNDFTYEGATGITFTKS